MSIFSGMRGGVVHSIQLYSTFSSFTHTYIGIALLLVVLKYIIMRVYNRITSAAKSTLEKPPRHYH